MDTSAKTSHGNGRRKQSVDNPSYARIDVLSVGAIYGVNINFYDGHVSWHRFLDLEDCGLASPWDNKRIYSVMP